MGGRAAVLTVGPSARPVLSVQRLELSPIRPRLEEVDWETPIDRSRLFLCETLTPLYYTPSYAGLPAEHRRRYNQLTGMLANELILRLESGFIDTALAAVTRHDDADAELVSAVRRLHDDEARHAEGWRQLNRLSEPGWYLSDRPRLLRVPRIVDRLARALARSPVACPVILWIQLTQEERSMEISRRCLRMPPGAIEPRYAAVYGEHLRDEARHVQLDCHLIERVYAAQSLPARRLTARVFRWVLANLFLRPARSSVRVIEVLAAECRELQPRLPQMVRELRALDGNDAYQEMMYSRRTTPHTFDLFDTFPEFHAMRTVLRAYTPAGSAGRPR